MLTGTIQSTVVYSQPCTTITRVTYLLGNRPTFYLHNCSSSICDSYSSYQGFETKSLPFSAVLSDNSSEDSNKLTIQVHQVNENEFYRNLVTNQLGIDTPPPSPERKKDTTLLTQRTFTLNHRIGVKIEIDGAIAKIS